MSMPGFCSCQSSLEKSCRWTNRKAQLLDRRRNFQKGGYCTGWSEKARCSVHCNCLILGEVARPERFELPAFWFVVEKSGNPKALQVSHLQAARFRSMGIVRDRDSRVQHTFQPCFVLDDERRAFDLHELLSLEFTKQSRYRLSRGSDRLGNLFVRERKRDLHLTLAVVMTFGNIQKETGQLLPYRMGQANVPHFGNRRMIGFTKLLRHSQGCLAMLAQESQKILSRNKIRLSWFDDFGRELVGFPGNRGGQTQYLSRVRDSDNQAFPVCGRCGKLDATTAQNEDSAR